MDEITLVIMAQWNSY